jgi:DNA-binding MarR family transcriptional regulator
MQRGSGQDATDRQLDRLAQTYPDLDVHAYHVTARLARLGLYLARRQEAVFERFGLNRGEVGLLSALRLAGPPHRLAPGRLGRGLLLSSAGVTSRVDRLERRGLVVRQPDPDDRRGVLIELTARGGELVDEAVRANTESEMQLMANFDPGEIDALAALLRRLAVRLESGGTS